MASLEVIGPDLNEIQWKAHQLIVGWVIKDTVLWHNEKRARSSIHNFSMNVTSFL